ncbi:MAG: histidine phosphatase family protein [Hyphomicrobium sp.]
MTVHAGSTTELILIRHAPALTGGCVAGRRDVAADCSDGPAFAALKAALGAVDNRLTSPALRCRQTAAALWPDRSAATADPALWEQDFGDWEGIAFDELPDLGKLSGAVLAEHRPPGGESFADVCARVGPALAALADHGGRIAIVAHAGTVRAALALALGPAAQAGGLALAFHIAPLSLTRITAVPGGGWAVHCVNWTPATGTAA